MVPRIRIWQAIGEKESGEVMEKGEGMIQREVLEKHYTTEEIAKAWALEVGTVQRIFKGRKGVIHLGTPKKRVLRIPGSIIREVLSEKGA
jgi:hypothetical protein